MNLFLNHSLLFYLRSKGAYIGKGVLFGKWPNILLRDGASLKNLKISNNVKIDDRIYIRMRSEGQISIFDNARLCKDVWLTVASKEVVWSGGRTIIGPYNIINGGHGVHISNDCVFSSFINITSSDHNIKKGIPIMKQGFNGKPIHIGNNVLIGSHVFIKQGVNVGHRAIIGAGSVVLNNIDPDWVVGGNPARV